MKYEGVSKMSEKSMLEAVKNYLIRRPKVRIAQTRFVYINVQALYRRSSKCSKTKLKSLVVYGITRSENNMGMYCYFIYLLFNSFIICI